jgi:beta-barrel assembly-enhancing protease
MSFGAAAQSAEWAAPARFTKPDLSTDEGGLWAMFDREEIKMRRSPFTLRDSVLRDYLQNIACKMAGDHCPDLRVYAARVPYFNASMAPNGMMQIWSGLLLRVENEAQLAAIIGHEMGHYMQRHSLERLRDQKAKSAFIALLAPFGLVGALGGLAAAASHFAFSRSQELEADTIGLALMLKAGYDPKEAAKIWRNLRAELAASPDGDPMKNSPMFATHPPSDERTENLDRLASATSGGFVGSNEFSERIAFIQADLLEDEIKRGQYDETLVLLDRMIDKQNQRSDLHYFRGEVRRLRAKGNDLEAASNDFDRAIQLGNEPFQLHRAKGYIHLQRNQNEQARSSFAQYLERAPNAPDAGLIRQHLN